jgi:hypothetical protein
LSVRRRRKEIGREGFLFSWTPVHVYFVRDEGILSDEITLGSVNKEKVKISLGTYLGNLPGHKASAVLLSSPFVFIHIRFGIDALPEGSAAVKAVMATTTTAGWFRVADSSKSGTSNYGRLPDRFVVN